MKNKKHIAALLVIGLAAACLMGGCNKKKEKETDTAVQSESVTPETVPPETEAPKVTYTSASGTFSLELPDASWAAVKEDVKNRWVFQAEGKGKITVAYKASGIGRKKLPNTQEEAEALLNKEKENAFQNVEFRKESVSSADLYYYAADAVGLEYSYLVKYLVNAQKEGYIITGEAAASDAETIQAVKNAVTSFQILKEADVKKDDVQGEDASGNESEEKADDSGSADDAEAEVTEEEYRYFFDADGNTIYTYPSEDGAWRDENGKSYIFLENGVEDSDGTKYYYDPPQYREDGAESSGEGQTADFYDKDGNYITATLGADGKWLGSDGKTYTFSEEGITDSEGNFIKW